METDQPAGVGDDTESSPLKKRSGSSKTGSRRTGTRLVSPPDQGTATHSVSRATAFLDTFIYPQAHIILELAITLKSEKAFKEFMQALMAFLTSAQMVDPKFVINPINPNSKEKNIASKGEISPNMTKLGSHVKISGNGNTFNKQKVWDKEGDSVRQSRKANKKEEFKDPTVYFSMVISSEVNPTEIIERNTHEWSRLNGARLQIKDLQFMESETVVSIYKVLKDTPKDVILKELERILLMTQEKARDAHLDQKDYDFLLDTDVEYGKLLPDMNLRVKIAKLKGQEVSTFNQLSNKAQYARKSWHLEVASKYVVKMKQLIQTAKEY
jgi:hypothetical protein